jgi:predicted Zn-dependent protease
MGQAKQALITRRTLLKLAAANGLGLGTFSLLSGCAVDPVTGKNSFVGMSKENEIAMDHKSSPYQFSADYGVSRDTQLNEYVNRVGMELATRSHRPDMPFSYRVVNAAYVNAYAFPGGSIAATRGILLKLHNEAELAALLGHETGHVNARHAAEQAAKGTFAQLLLAGATIASSAAGYGNAAGLIQNLGGIGAGALLARYSRDNEREADALGVEYMTRAGYSPLGMVGLMQILQELNKGRAASVQLLFATHPMSAERLRFAEQAANGQYHAMINNAMNRERFMDRTARLRRIKGAIEALQDGSTAMGKKKFNEAEHAFTKALRVAPNDYAALVMMGKYQLSQKRPKRAIRYAERAIHVYPQEAQGHLIAGFADLKLGRYGKVIEQLDRYDAILPGNPEVQYYKGLSFEKMGRRQDAAKQYNLYLRKVRKGEHAKYAYTRLRSWGYIRR